MRKTAAGLAMLSGCAWIFQEHLPAEYKVEPTMAEPRCSTSSTAEVFDIIFGTLNVIAIGTEVSNEKRTDQDNEVLAFAILEGILHFASAGTGSRWAKDCEKAQHAWDARGRESRPDGVAVVSHRAASVPTPPMPQFFCSASKTDGNVGFCARSQHECDEQRTIEITATPDLEACSSAESARCLSYADPVDHAKREICAPTAASCNKRRDAVIMAAPDATECVETR